MNTHAEAGFVRRTGADRLIEIENSCDFSGFYSYFMGRPTKKEWRLLLTIILTSAGD